MAKAAYSKQGMYLWSLIKQAGWDKPHIIKNDELRIKNGGRLKRYEAYLLKTFKVTHINALTEDEIRRAIVTLTPYAAKGKHEACKPMRQQIAGLVCGKGYDMDWLHQMMAVWGFFPSMRELGYADLVVLRGNVMKALGIESVKAIKN